MCVRKCEKGGGEWQTNRESERGTVYFFHSVLEGNDFDVQQLGSTVGETPHIHFPPPLSERCLSLQEILPQLRRIRIAEDERIGFQRRRLQTGRDRCCRRRKEEQSKPGTRRRASEEEFWNSCPADVLPVRSKPSRAERERESEREDVNGNTLHHPEADYSLGQGTSGTTTTERRKEGHSSAKTGAGKTDDL